jgi:DNA-directed RNA polymerase subunit M/transcription elongation factor TFIIS
MIRKLVKHVSKSKENREALIRELSSFDEDEARDRLYEVGFIAQEKDLKTAFHFLKKDEIGLKYPDFKEIAQKMNEMDTFMDKPFEAQEGVNECSKCHGSRTISFSKQIRSGDEGAHVQVFCIDCKYRFFMNS